MRNSYQLTKLASAAVLVAGLAACASQPMYSPSSASSYPSTSYPTGNTAPSYVEYGQVTGVELIRTQEQARGSGAGAVIGGIAGGVLGHQIGRGTGRDLATIAGVAGGAIAKSQSTRSQTT